MGIVSAFGSSEKVKSSQADIAANIDSSNGIINDNHNEAVIEGKLTESNAMQHDEDEKGPSIEENALPIDSIISSVKTLKAKTSYELIGELCDLTNSLRESDRIKKDDKESISLIFNLELNDVVNKGIIEAFDLTLRDNEIYSNIQKKFDGDIDHYHKNTVYWIDVSEEESLGGHAYSAKHLLYKVFGLIQGDQLNNVMMHLKDWRSRINETSCTPGKVQLPRETEDLVQAFLQSSPERIANGYDSTLRHNLTIEEVLLLSLPDLKCSEPAIRWNNDEIDFFLNLIHRSGARSVKILPNRDEPTSDFEVKYCLLA